MVLGHGILACIERAEASDGEHMPIAYHVTTGRVLVSSDQTQSYRRLTCACSEDDWRGSSPGTKQKQGVKECTQRQDRHSVAPDWT